MPEVSRFNGIVIRMFFKHKEHEPPHIHATYGEYAAIYDIETYQRLDGEMPQKAHESIQRWMTIHKKELRQMWDTQRIGPIPPL